MKADAETITKKITLRGREIELMSDVIPTYITKGLTLDDASMLPLTRTTLEEPHAMSITVTAPRNVMDAFSNGVAMVREFNTPTTATIIVTSQEEYELLAPAFTAIYGEKLKRPHLGMPRTTTVNSNSHLDRRFKELLNSLESGKEAPESDVDGEGETAE